MKILFSADWHIKLGQKNVPKEWALARYREFFKQLHDLEKTVDLHIIGGDIFDRSPSLEELNLFFEYLQAPECDIVFFDGNHEASRKNQTFLEDINIPFDVFSQYSGKTITGVFKPESLGNLVSSNSTALDEAVILPYTYLHRKEWGSLVDNAKVLFTHVRGAIPPHVQPEVDLTKFDKYKVVFAGDLHSHSNTQRNIVYPGSPMTISFHRNEVENGVLVIDSDDWSWEWVKLQLPQLIKKTVSSPEEMVPTNYNHTIYELEGDLESLSKVGANDLLDKKIVKRSSEASLLLDPEMTIEAELQEYLEFILELPPEKIKKVMKAFSDYRNVEV